MSTEAPLYPQTFRQPWMLAILAGLILMCPVLIEWQGMLGLMAVVGLAGFVVSLFTHPLLVLGMYFGALFFEDTTLKGLPVSINQILAPLFFLSTAVYWVRGKSNSAGFKLFPVLAVTAAYFTFTGLIGEDIENGLIYGRYAVIYLLLALAVGMVLSSERKIYALAWIIVCTTSIAAAHGLYEAMDKNLLNVAGNFLGSKRRVMGTAPNSIVFGWNLVFAFPFAFFLFAQMRSAAMRLLALCLGLFILAVACFTFNRQTYILIAIVVGMCSILYTYRNRAALLSLLTVCGAIGAMTVFPLVLRRMLTITNLSKDYSYLERRDSYLMGIEMIKENPIFGVGFGAYSKVWSQYIPADYTTYFAQYRGTTFEKFMDMGLFSITAETGFIGLFLFLALVLTFGIYTWRRRKAAVVAGDTLVQNLASTVLVVLVFFFTSSFIQDTFLYTRIWILYGVALLLDPRHLPVSAEKQPITDTEAATTI